MAASEITGPAGEWIVVDRKSWPRRHRVALVLTPSIVLAALLGLVGAVGWIGSERAIQPHHQPAAHRLSEYPFAAVTQPVQFSSLDGTPLAGWFVPSGRDGPAATVILLHGYGGTRAEMLPQAAYLHGAGYNVLLFDFRGNGASGGGVTLGAREPLDVRAAVRYALGRPDVDPARISLQGISLGAVSGIIAMRDDPRIRTLIVESAFSDLRGVIDRSFEHFIGLPSFPFAPATVFIVEQRLNASVAEIRPLDAIKMVGNRAVLIIDDLKDTEIPAGSGVHLYAAAAGPKELWLIPGAGHADGYKVQPQEYERRVLAFYAKYLTQ